MLRPRGLSGDFLAFVSVRLIWHPKTNQEVPDLPAFFSSWNFAGTSSGPPSGGALQKLAENSDNHPANASEWPFFRPSLLCFWSGYPFGEFNKVRASDRIDILNSGKVSPE